MFRRRDAEAVAALTAQFSAHQSECIRDKAEIKRALAEQDAERQRMHHENSSKFEKINRIIWLATGVFTALQFFASHGDIAAAFMKVMHP